MAERSDSSVTNASSQQRNQPSYWIFHARSQAAFVQSGIFDKGEKVYWLIKEHAKDIKPYDVVFFWLSGQHEGMYGWGEVAKPGVMMRKDVPTDILGDRKGKTFALINNVEEFDPFIRKSVFQRHSVLSSLSIMKQPHRTNLSIEPLHLLIVKQLINNLNYQNPNDSGSSTTGVSLSLGMLGDQPIRSSTQDALSFEPVAAAIAGLIDNPATELPFTIAINAPWGAGKSSLGHLIEEKLVGKPAAAGSLPHVTTWFNAWMHDDPSAVRDYGVASAFIAAMARAMNARRPLWRKLLYPLPPSLRDPNRKRSWLRWTTIVTLALLISLVLWALSSGRETLFTAGGILEFAQDKAPWPIGILAGLLILLVIVRKTMETAKTVEHFVRNPGEEASEGWVEHVRSELCSLVRENVPEGSRLVVFVDDLDRCRPPGSVILLETIHQILAEAPIVVVVMADLPAVAASAGAKYQDLGRRYVPSGESWHDSDSTKIFGRLYIQKMIQLQFDLPDQRFEEIRSLMESSIAPIGRNDDDGDTLVVAEERVGVRNPMVAAWNPSVSATHFLIQWSRLANWWLVPVGFLAGVSLLPGFVFARHAVSVGCPKSLRELHPSLSLSGLGRIMSRLGNLAPLLYLLAAIVLTTLYEPFEQLPMGTHVVLLLLLLFLVYWLPIYIFSVIKAERLHSSVITARREAANLGVEELDTLDDERDRIAKSSQLNSQLANKIIREQQQLYLANDSKEFKEAREAALTHLRLRPRSLKRLINRLRLLIMIVAARNGLRGENPIQPEELGKWVAVQERWPELAMTLVSRPELMKELEEGRSMEDMQAVLPKHLDYLLESRELRDTINAEPRLSGVMERLVFMEISVSSFAPNKS